VIFDNNNAPLSVMIYLALLATCMIISASFFQITLGSGSPLGGRQGKLTESPIAAEIFNFHSICFGG
jgi:hypothetical protein